MYNNVASNHLIALHKRAMHLVRILDTYSDYICFLIGFLPIVVRGVTKRQTLYFISICFVKSSTTDSLNA